MVKRLRSVDDHSDVNQCIVDGCDKPVVKPDQNSDEERIRMAMEAIHQGRPVDSSWYLIRPDEWGLWAFSAERHTLHDLPSCG